MKIATIYYEAKDGRIFTDPLECEEHEKSLGVIPNSVGMLINELECLAKPELYMHGTVMILKDDGKRDILIRNTECVDDFLESYVNVKDLREEQRYLCENVGNFIKTLKKYDKDCPCQYMIVWSDSIDLDGPGIMANYNQKVWGKKD